MISPIGSFLVRFDTAILAAMDAGITGLTAYLATPVMTSIAIFYLIQGVRIAKGDGAPVQHFVTQLFRNVMILWFCSRADIYNKWVENIFFVSLPSALNKAVMAKMLTGITMTPGVTGTAAAFDQVWALMDQLVDRVLATASFADVSSRLAATAFGLAGGLALLVIAMVYLMSRFILAIVLELGVIAIACLIFESTKAIFERWLGKVIALVFLQVTAIVVLQLVITIEQDFMKQSVGAAGSGGVPGDVQALTAMVTMFFMGAFAIYSLPAIAYSIGTGVSVSALPAMYLAAKALQGAAGALSGIGASIPEFAAGGERAGLSMGLAPGEAASLRPPPAAALPPPPLSIAGY